MHTSRRVQFVDGLWLIWREGVALYLRSKEDRQVGEAGDAHQWLVYQDGIHGLLDTVLGLQGGKEQFHFLPMSGTKEHLWISVVILTANTCLNVVCLYDGLPLHSTHAQSNYYTITVCDYCVDIPNLAAFKHACVHNIGAHKSSPHSLNLLSQQLVGQRLMEAHCSKLTGTVILSQIKTELVFTVS